jgi:outer membrane protein, multidrug efflux system
MRNKSIKLAITLALTASILGCAVGPDYKTPAAPEVKSFANASTIFQSGEIVTHFWEQFNDAELTRLIDAALLANHDLKIAMARVDQVRALRRQGWFDFAPTIRAKGGYTKQELAMDQVQPGMPRTTELYDAGFEAAWELDLFGRVRRANEARNAELQSAVANWHDAQTIVIAEVVRSYFELRGAQQQLAVAQRNIDNQQESLKLVTARLDAGRGTEFDTARAQTQLSNTSASVAPLQTAVARSSHRLNVLLGRAPEDESLKTLIATQLLNNLQITTIPEHIAIGDPGLLLRRRPDIQRAERELAASTANIGVAVGDLFPKVTFTGSVGYAAMSTSRLGDSSSQTYRLGPSISWAAFDLGRVRAQIAVARARADEQLARYEQTVLRALEETENALVLHSKSRERLIHAQAAADASATAARIARLRFEGGALDFLAVLDAERAQLQSQDQLARIQTEVATSLVTVYQALGVGWESVPVLQARSRYTAN